jgi:hypothetical protein
MFHSLSLALKDKNRYFGLIFFTLCFAMAVMVYFYFFINIDVEIELQSDSESTFQLFWAGKAQGYREAWSKTIDIDKKTKRLTIAIPDYQFVRLLNPITKLRIDPLRESSEITINHVVVKQLGYHPIRLTNSEEFNKLIPLNDIKTKQFGQDGLKIVTSGEDPQLELAIISDIDYIFLMAALILSLTVGLILGVLFNSFNADGLFAYSPYLMTVVLALILTGSIICEKLHFDEYVHVEAAIFYENHWLPPEICDPDTEDTYSVYGNSRLNSYEIVYLLAGKFSRLMRFTSLNEYVRSRLFNIFLFLILLLLSVYKWEYRILTLPLIISPQIWYTFSYFNSEAFALFVLVLISYQILCKESYFNEYLMKTEVKKEVIHTIIIGLCFSVMLLIKNTFYIFMIFILLHFFIRLLNKEFANPRIALKRTILIILIALSVFGLRYALDIYINGFDRKAKLSACKEKLAEPMYKASTELIEQHPYINLKDREVTLREMFTDRYWGVLSFASTFGNYNYGSAASRHYYKIFFLLTAGLGFFVSISFITDRSCLIPSKRLLLLLNFILCGIVVLGLSIWHSWVHDFQAQGRYLFPILTMFGFLLLESLPFINKRFLNFFIIAMFMLSAYSYLFICLIAMPKF